MDDQAARQLHNHPRTERTPWGLLLLLMALTSIGPTTLNIVVPALPTLAKRLAADGGTVQLIVSIYLLAMAAGQLLMGSLSDRFGRRPVLIAALLVTACASVSAVLISTVQSLIVARVLQAIGASAGVVVSRAIIRDLFDRNRAASTLGLVATVMAVVPTLSPLIGGLLETGFGWEAIFIFTAVTSALAVTWAAITLPETRGLNAPQGARQGFFRDLAQLAQSARFSGYVLAGAFGSATFYAFLGGGAHVVITLMARSPAEYGIWFAMSSIGYIAGNFISSRLSGRYGIHRMIWSGIIVEVVGVTLSTVLTAFALHWGPFIVFVPQMIVNLGNGLLLPGAIAGAVSVRPQAAGTAAGITGFTQMALGALIAQYAGTLMAGAPSALPLSFLMNALVAVLVISFAALVRRP
ncbi:multidrug effflux MFS transporter [Rhodoplanes sp. Z2-YC6860]|uniref:multidrug effflux MFS transporter n=1 Tax=Rhodoplanes sp. Z2-YC6860 TaxID=674703 RepID=UPI00078B9C7C|nr:multidrug effflux MFS transporter [Rhodoplanes sp. Z2-YC6860]AMN44229.1 drug resistance transporter, Bcr/CflA subfamily [Rhodoplanes sp. Z2-YC6860]